MAIAVLRFPPRISHLCKRICPKMLEDASLAAGPCFFFMREGISIRNHLWNPIKMVRMLYKYDFWCELVVFVVKKVEKSHIYEQVDF